ncbi:hypothetical protein [Rhizobium laguerreae]|uniref:hypothetical protein n=1 Tax=Rhizobium laguerreae TaxID=1076926 RepID=UPI0030091237
MDDEVKKSLDKIFAQHREAKEVRAIQKEQSISAEEEFKVDFETAADQIIVPVMNEIGEYIKAQGYSFRVDRQAERVTNIRTNRSQPAMVRLVIVTSAVQSHSDKNPAFSVFAEKSSKKVRFHESTRNLSGPAGEYPLSALSRDLLQSRILELLKKVFQ